MSSIPFHPHASRNLLLRLLALGLVVAVLLAWQADWLRTLYIDAQLTLTGWVVNGAILLLFGSGLASLILNLLRGIREERALARFIDNAEDDSHQDPTAGVWGGSLIARRYHDMRQLYERHTPVPHGALAASLLAQQSTRLSFAKFINNILILAGVFGTIVSLSIALVGASDLLESAVDVGGMGMIVHGMTTALSTTITAILCYAFFGYFYLKTADAQTQLIGSLEQTTATLLMPRFQVEKENLMHEFSGMLRGLHALIRRMGETQTALGTLEQRLMQGLDSYHERVGALEGSVHETNRLLRSGFRLPDDA